MTMSTPKTLVSPREHGLHLNRGRIQDEIDLKNAADNLALFLYATCFA
jgi:hypothetical protein